MPVDRKALAIYISNTNYNIITRELILFSYFNSTN